MPWAKISRVSCFLATIAACVSGAARSEEPVRVSGYFCGAQNEQVAFLQRQVFGENEEIAANVINKAVGRQTCAFYLPAHAIPVNDHTVMRDGIVYKVQSYIFLPEKVERWTGTYFGSLQPTKKFSEL